MDKPQAKRSELVSRGRKNASPLGSSVLVGLRLLDPFFQHAILVQGLGSSLILALGGRVIPQGTPIPNLGVSPHQLVILLMAAGSSLKQIWWLLVVSQEEMPVGAAVAISLLNTVLNLSNTLLFMWDATSTALSPALSESGFPSSPVLVGGTLYTVGILIEAFSELQRYRFKRDPDNKGKLYTGGLFSLARHANYGGYTLWRAGYATASGGWTYGAVIAGLFFYDFASRAIPILDDYCGSRVSFAV